MENERRAKAWRLVACALRTMEIVDLPLKILQEVDISNDFGQMELHERLTKLGRSFGLQALRELESAAEVLNEQAWLWYKIGDLNQVCGPNPDPSPDSHYPDDNPEAYARSEAAFLRAADLDPYDPCAQYRLASIYSGDVLPFDSEYQFFVQGMQIRPDRHTLRQAEESLAQLDAQDFPDYLENYRANPMPWVEYVERSERALWESRAGHHLRLFLNNGGVQKLITRTVPVFELDRDIDYLEKDMDSWKVKWKTWSLGCLLPSEQRSDYYNQTGTILYQAGWIEEREAKEFFEEARRWGDHDSPAVLQAEINLAKASAAQMNLIEAADILTQAVEQVRFTALSPDSATSLLGAIGELAQTWRSHADPLSDSSLWTLVLEAPEDLLQKTIPCTTLALIAEAAGRGAIGQGRLDTAEDYLLRAKQYDPKLSSAARDLAQLYIQQRRWRHAADEQERLISLTSDPHERHILALLRDANSSGFTSENHYEEIIRYLQMHSQMLEQMRVSQDLVLSVAAEQDRAEQQLAVSNVDLETIIQDLIDQLHKLILEGSQIQPAAIRDTRNRLAEELSEDILNSLHPDTQQFLLTAEVFCRAGRGVLSRVDAALISVEYAKVVETELYHGFLAGLEVFMERQEFGMPLVIGERSLTRDPKSKRWVGVFTRTKSFRFADISSLIQVALGGRGRQVLNQYFEGLGFEETWWRQLITDLKTISDEYRNGAAHKDHLNRETLDEFRALLFEGKLLKRLADLSRRAAAASSAAS